MREITHIKYRCDICHTEYDNKKEALYCESRAVGEERGVEVGDIVRITGGDGTGSLAKVERRHVLSKDWGLYAADRYWHTVALTAKLVDSWGHRQLTFDQYDVVDK